MAAAGKKVHPTNGGQAPVDPRPRAKARSGPLPQVSFTSHQSSVGAACASMLCENTKQHRTDEEQS